MAKKITISELVIKLQADTKEAAKAIKSLDKLANDVGKNQVKQKEKQERQEKQSDKEAQTRLRHQERMQLAAHRAKLKREDVLLRERLKAGERIRREEAANHRRALQEQRQREREAARARRGGGNRRNGNGGFASGVAASAVGNVIANSISGGISGALSGLITAIGGLYDMAKERAISREQIGFALYSAYKDKGSTDEEALNKSKTDVDTISKIANNQGASFANVGKTYQALLSTGESSDKAEKLTNSLFSEVRALGLGEEATTAIVRELKPLFMGSGISAESFNTLEEWNALPIVANLLGMSVKELAKISKEGKLNAVTQTYTPDKLQQNLEKYGDAKYSPDYFKGDSVTKASQELDAAINNLKDVFSKHASGGIATALNALADVLAKKETQEAIVSAGESFGEAINQLNKLLVGFIDSGALQSFFDVLSKENIQAVADGFGKLIDVVGRFVDFLDWVLPDSKPNPKPEDLPPSKVPVKMKYDYRRGWVREDEKDPAKAPVVPSQADSTLAYNPATGETFSDTKENIRALIVQENIKTSLEASKPTVPMIAPSTTSNSTSSTVNSNNVTHINNTVHGDVTEKFARDFVTSHKPSPLVAHPVPTQ